MIPVKDETFLPCKYNGQIEDNKETNYAELSVLMSEDERDSIESGPEVARVDQTSLEQLSISVVNNEATNSLSSVSSSGSGLFSARDRSAKDQLADDSNLHFACAKARSIVEKIGSLITLFEECNLHFALLTETWLNKKHCSPRALSDLTIGANLSFIRKDRRGGGRGGGVAICYNPTKIKMTAFNTGPVSNNYEVVCAIGTLSLIHI